MAAGPVSATVQVPGSKSLTNRYLLLAALAQSPSRLRSPLDSRDSRLMMAALEQLGAEFEEVPGEGPFSPDIAVTPIAFEDADPRPQLQVDCGLAGTVMRFVPPVAALLAADVDFDASASSQFVSALLLAAPRFSDGLQLRHEGPPVPSLPHVDMTLSVLREVGVNASMPAGNLWQVDPGSIEGFDVAIEPDLSNAGPFLAAAVVTGGSITIPGWPETTTQGGNHWRQILSAFGAQVEYDGGRLRVTGPGTISGVDLDLSEAGELAPTAAALAALASSPSRLRGIGHLRGHETDRLAALVAEINRLGGDAAETSDGITINPAALHGGIFHSYEDHRMATAGAIIGLAVDGVEVENIDTTAKTMPEFAQMWQHMLEPEGSTGGA
jgi:3-phosphoshikimate 1-carboxyvinyltransferase